MKTRQSGDQAAKLSGDHPDRPTAGPPDRPPIAKTWPRLYALVLIWLAVQVAIYYAFTRAFE